LLKRALTHSSASSTGSFERLEFLGDRVLGLIVADKLHALYPHDAEGAMAVKYNTLVRKEACAKAAEAAGLGSGLVLANSESNSGGRQKAGILADACEAIIAALYLDGGIEAARTFFECYWQDNFGDLGRDMRDAKTTLQEWTQALKGNPAPTYRVLSHEGPSHAPRFVIEVAVPGHPAFQGEGSSKREAEQNAAIRLLAHLGVKR
jgi:ribonuclease-3